MRTWWWGGDATVLFVRHITTIIVSITDPSCWDTPASVVTLERVWWAGEYTYAPNTPSTSLRP